MIEYETMEDSIINPPLPQNSVNKNEQPNLNDNNFNQGQYSNITDQIDHFNTINSNYQQNNSHFNNNFERRDTLYGFNQNNNNLNEEDNSNSSKQKKYYEF
jgi:hypothetical protein